MDHSNEIPHVVVPRGKDGRPARVPLVEDGLAAACEFMALDAYGPWRTETVNKRLAEAAHKAGRKPFTTYQMRYSFATALRKAGADLADIQHLYGHTNWKTTEIYAPADMGKNLAAIERVRAAEKAIGQTGNDSVDNSKPGGLLGGAQRKSWRNRKRDEREDHR